MAFRPLRLSLVLAVFLVEPAGPITAQRSPVPPVPCVYWSAGVGSRGMLDAAGIRRLCVPPGQVEAWQSAGFSVSPITEAELASRATLPSPGIAARAGLASPTRSPWIVANGWRFTRHPTTKYVYDVPFGRAALAAAESFAYGADAVIKMPEPRAAGSKTDSADPGTLGRMLAFLEEELPAADLPLIADLAVVDDGSVITGEVMNLLARRNLLFQVVQAPSPRFHINVAIGSPGYPREEAADPSAFALKIRRQLTDDQRSVRVYGSEVVICRLTGDGERVRVQLINYGGREIEGLRIRLRGAYGDSTAYAAGMGRVALEDLVVAEGATEFSIPRMGTYAVIDLRRSSEGPAGYVRARTFSRNTRFARAFTMVSAAVAPIRQHSTMIGPSNPAPFSTLKTPAKSTFPAPN